LNKYLSDTAEFGFAKYQSCFSGPAAEHHSARQKICQKQETEKKWQKLPNKIPLISNCDFSLFAPACQQAGLIFSLFLLYLIPRKKTPNAFRHRVF
jgi:hypothetical protein